MRVEGNRKNLRIAGWTLAALFVIASATWAQKPRGQVAGTLVDGDGNPVPKYQLVFTPVSGGSAIKIKTNKSGAFSHGFVPSGNYVITASSPDDYLSHFDILVEEPTGMERNRWASDAHPQTGLPPVQISAALKTVISLVMTDASHRARVEQAMAAAEVAGPLQAALDMYEAGQVEEALAEAQKALAEQPTLAFGHFLSGVALSKLDRLDEAVPALRRALELDPEMQDAAGALGTALLQQGQRLQESDAEAATGLYGEAASLFESQVEGTSAPAAALLGNWALALTAAGDLDRAKEVLERTISEFPDEGSAYYRLAEIHRKAGDDQAALSVLERAPKGEGEGTSADAIYNVAVRHFNAGELDQAEAVLDRAAGVDPDFALVHHLRGRILLAREDYDGAVAALKRFVELVPEGAASDEDRMIIESLASMKDSS